MTLELSPQAIEEIVVNNNIARLDSTQRLQYIEHLCNRLGLDPLAKPFEIMRLNGKERLYATKACTDQLRAKHGLSINDVQTEVVNDIYVAKASALDQDGRTDSDIGTVQIKGLGGDNLANAMMKAVTKAKRRVTLSFYGLGMLDELEVETIQGAETGDAQEGISKKPVRKKVTKSKPKQIDSQPPDELDEQSLICRHIDLVQPKEKGEHKWWNIQVEGDERTFSTFSKTFSDMAGDLFMAKETADVLIKKKTNSSGQVFWNIAEISKHISLVEDRP